MCAVHLALEHSRSRCSVRLRASVKIEQDSRIGRTVRARQAHTRRCLASGTACDVDLRTFLYHCQPCPFPLISSYPVPTSPLPLHAPSGISAQGSRTGATYHIELCALRRTRTMQRNQLSPKQILARSNALRDGDSLYASCGDQTVDAPFRAVEAVFGDLEPPGCAFC